MGVNEDTLRRHYKKKWSGFQLWNQLTHADKYLLYAHNITSHMAIDEVSLSQGELYTIFSSRDSLGRKGKVAAVIRGTKAEDLIKVLALLTESLQETVKEVALDMSMSMAKAARWAFPNAALVTDRFHVERLSADAVQQARIDQRWEEIDREAKAIIKCKKQGTKYKPIILTKGDTPKQLLARSRYILCKMSHQWTKTQMRRAYLLYQLYPSIEQAYRFHRDFKNIYKLEDLHKVKTALDEWIRRAQDSNIEYFQSVAETLIAYWERIVEFFANRSTNAHAESLNAQIKHFRSNLHGVPIPNTYSSGLRKSLLKPSAPQKYPLILYYLFK